MTFYCNITLSSLNILIWNSNKPATAYGHDLHVVITKKWLRDFVCKKYIMESVKHYSDKYRRSGMRVTDLRNYMDK